MKRTKKLLTLLPILLSPMFTFASPAAVPAGCKVWMVPEGPWLSRLLVCSQQKTTPSCPLSQQITDRQDIMMPPRIG